MKLHTTRQFERDLKLAAKRRKDINKLQAIVEMLCSGKSLLPRHKLHALRGEWIPALECHIEPDWLLIFEVHSDHIMLLRTGTHSDLFG